MTKFVFCLRLNSWRPHPFRNDILGTRITHCQQFTVTVRSSVSPLMLGRNDLNQLGHSESTLRLVNFSTRSPGLIAARRNSSYSAHRLDWSTTTRIPHEANPHRLSLAKKTVGLLKMSRSRFSGRCSSRSRRNSSCSGANLPFPGNA